MRDASYRFFQNRACEFFPCHTVEDVEKFNCLFCYCPLYLREKCLGNPSYLVDGRGCKIKDCSNCTVVHRPEMYDEIMHQLGRQDQVLELSIRSFWNEILERMAEIAGWHQMDEEMSREHRSTAVSAVTNLLQKHKYFYRVEVLLQPFDKSCVQDGKFQFGGQEIRCNVLERIDRSQVENGYIYAFHAPDINVDEGESLLAKYYLEVFQIACMDVCRQQIQDYLERKHSVLQKQYCSPSFGPGYYGMDIDAVPKLISFLEADTVGVKWQEDKLYPIMSLVGVYLISKGELLAECKDCAGCLGQAGGCQYCMNR